MFTSADSVAGSIGSPQSLNRYAYVGNNPMNFSDPTGHDRFSASSNGFAETMGQGGYMSPEDPDNDDPTGLAHRAHADGFWRDEHGLASWLQIDFNGSKTIDEVDVFTIPDYPAYLTQANPSATQTFTQYGATSFTVQYWTGSAWATVSGGSITGNNLVWKKINFAAITTSKIKVVVNAVPDGVARIAEVEAWGDPSGTSASIQWLVTDQLGTPRMVFDKTGALANVKRHDYLPFGEEIFAGTGGRTTTQGYPTSPNSNDGVRQKFTSQERDNETGLDYMHARYFASAQGRFSSADSVAGSIGNPQSLNRYAYVGNNPMNFSDPTGHTRFDASSNGFNGAEQGGYMSPEDPDYDPESILTENMRNSLHSWNQRLQNTRDSIAANDAQANGDYDRRDQIMAANSTLEFENGSSANVTVSAVVGDPQGLQYSSDSTNIIIWEGALNPFGHVSYITMQDDISYSWEGVVNWTIDNPSSDFTQRRSTGTLGSTGTGYILDFGSLNAKFQNHLLHAYDGLLGIKQPYGPTTNNCAKAGINAINYIRKDLQSRDGIRLPRLIDVRPSAVKAYIENNLMGYVRGMTQYPYH